MGILALNSLPECALALIPDPLLVGGSSSINPQSHPQLAHHQLGRVAAEQALRALGYNGAAQIEKASDGYPLFPSGYCGSISHTRGAAAALVGKTAQYAGVGIDLEPISRQISERARLRITTAEERATLLDRKRLLLALFCAKEALYKAIFPLTHKFFGFQDASLSWSERHSRFDARLLVDLGPQFSAGERFSLQILWEQSWVIALCALAEVQG